MTFEFSCFAVTHIGSRRKNNEDNFFIDELLTREEQSVMSLSGNAVIRKSCIADGTANRIFAVSDGMGGHEAGEMASFIVVDSISAFFREHPQKAIRKRVDKYAYVQNFQKMIGQINQKILAYAAEHHGGDMGATLSGLIVFADEAVPFNIGDSSVFLFEYGKLTKLTADDNELSMLERAGSPTLGVNGRRLTKYCGLPLSGGTLTAAMSEPLPLRLGQVYIIVSDGLTDSLPAERIAETVEEYSGSMEETANGLVNSAIDVESGGHDNITVVAVKVINTIKTKEW